LYILCDSNRNNRLLEEYKKGHFFGNKLFSAFEIIYTDEQIMNKAIDLRLTCKLKTPDSIIAATSLVKDIPLVTADRDLTNTPDLYSIFFEFP